MTEQLAGAVAAGRGLPVEQATALLARGPFLAQQALDAGLVDGLLYRDEVYNQVRREAGPDATLLYLQRYQRTQSLSDLPRRLGSSVQGMAPGQHERFVAMIYAHGAIRHGRSGRGGPGGGGMGSDTVAAALRAAAADEGARAVVLRVNSPGGSYTASDVIWREVVKLRAAGKPVVVSMGDVAASGGYFISAPADVIVAQPGTITGSIGVFMGKPVLRELFAPDGVATDTVADGAGAGNATMFSSSRPFSEAEWARINEWLDAVYADFTAEGGGRAAAARRAGARAGPRPGVDRRRRDRQRAGRRGRRPARGDRHRPQARRAARRRAGAELPPARAARPAAARRVERGAARGARPVGAGALAALFADGWGPAWRFAAAAGLPPHGPLTLPGVWKIQLDTEREPGDWTPPSCRLPPGPPAKGLRRGDGLRVALSAWAAGVTLLTIADDRDDIGTTVSAFMPVSLDPPLVAVSLIAGSYPAEVLSRPSFPAARFAVTLLSSSQKVIAGQFAAAGRPSARLILDAVPHTRGADVRRADPVRRAGRAGVLGRPARPGR